MFSWPDHPEHVKIGFTGRSVGERAENQDCYNNVQILGSFMCRKRPSNSHTNEVGVLICGNTIEHQTGTTDLVAVISPFNYNEP